MKVLFHFPWPFRMEYESDMEEPRLAILCVVWKRWYPAVQWVCY